VNDYYLKEHEWQYIFDYLSKIPRIHIKNREKLQRFVEAIYYVLRSGVQWRLLPKAFGHWRSIHNRFLRWRDKKIWHNLFAIASNDNDLQQVMIDATVVRSHACASGYKKEANKEQALGRSKGGFTTKIHALVDALGNPVKIVLTEGNRHDINKAEELVEGITNAIFIADKGYDSDKFRKLLQENKCITVIPPKKNRKIQYKYDKHIYKERHLVECFFSKLKQYRRVFSRFDKMKSTFQCFIDIASTLICIR
jgi:transposase